MKRVLSVILPLLCIGCVGVGVPGGDLTRELVYRLEYKHYYDTHSKVVRTCRFTTPDGPPQCTETKKDNKKDAPPT